MGILDRIGDLFIGGGGETKEAPMVMYQGVNAAPRSEYTYENLAKEGYQQNAIVYRCVNEISNGAAAVPFKVFQGDSELEAHPLLSLLNRPSPQFAGNEYFQALYSFLLLSGNSYSVRSDIGGKPAELHLLRPDRVHIKPSKTQIPHSYEYKLGGKVVTSYPVDPETGNSEVKHFKLWSPLDDYYGMSPINAAAMDIDQHNMAARHNVNLLNNGARPSGAIVFRPKDESGMPVQLSDSQRQQLHNDLNSRFSGTHNAGRSMLLEGDFDWKEMGLSPKDMDFLELKNMSARDIALCFGVPAQLVGVPDSQTYSNVAEARLALYEDTIIPLMRRVESDLNEWLAPLYEEGLEIKYDFDGIPAMAERRRLVYQNVVEAVREGIISRNEARDRLGLESIEGGDEVYINANLFPLGAPTEAPAEDPDADAEKAADTYAGKFANGEDVFDNIPDAAARAKRLGCGGTHTHKTPDGTVVMPCSSHEEYEKVAKEKSKPHDDLNDDAKAESDVDTKPTESMSNDAQRGLDMRKEFNRGGTAVGVARAVQLINRERLSPRTVRRMHSFFSRHEVDKRAQGFRSGEDGYPSAGKVAWLLWGGDSGQIWARRKVAQLDKQRDSRKEIEALMFPCCDDCDKSWPRPQEEKEAVSEKVKEALDAKVKEHNDKHGDEKGKRVTLRMLSAVFRRGVGAYNTNPSSVRPTVSSSDQWAYARVNVFLQAVRTGRFKSGKFDTDLLPKGHPLKTGD
jgi:HK97 family phage portal protein